MNHIAKPFTYQFMLTELERYQLMLLIKGLPVMDINRRDFDEQLLTIICHCSTYLPQRLGLFLLNFRARPNHEGAVLIQNLPLFIDASESACLEERNACGEWLLMLLMSSIADLIPYQDSSERRYIENIINTPSRAFYTEQLACSCKQDYVALFCLQKNVSAVVDDATLLPGEMLLVDNQIIAHEWCYDGKGQYLQHVSGVRDIRRKR